MARRVALAFALAAVVLGASACKKKRQADSPMPSNAAVARKLAKCPADADLEPVVRKAHTFMQDDKFHSALCVSGNFNPPAWAVLARVQLSGQWWSSLSLVNPDTGKSHMGNQHNLSALDTVRTDSASDLLVPLDVDGDGVHELLDAVRDGKERKLRVYRIQGKSLDVILESVLPPVAEGCMFSILHEGPSDAVSLPVQDGDAGTCTKEIFRWVGGKLVK